MNRLGLTLGAVLTGLVAMPAVADDRFKAVTTFTVIADMAQNVAGDAAIVESITKAGAEIHGYQPPSSALRSRWSSGVPRNERSSMIRLNHI